MCARAYNDYALPAGWTPSKARIGGGAVAMGSESVVTICTTTKLAGNRYLEYVAAY